MDTTAIVMATFDYSWVGLPSVALLIAAIGWWLKRETGMLHAEIDDKIDKQVCIEREQRIADRLQSGDSAFDQIIAALANQQRELELIGQTMISMRVQSQESDRLIGEALLVLCKALGGNGSCDKVSELLNKISESRLHWGE